MNPNSYLLALRDIVVGASDAAQMNLSHIEDISSEFIERMLSDTIDKLQEQLVRLRALDSRYLSENVGDSLPEIHIPQVQDIVGKHSDPLYLKALAKFNMNAFNEDTSLHKLFLIRNIIDDMLYHRDYNIIRSKLNE
jgi:hypothetical protein